MDRFTARRRLLRGSLSAPLVLTVASPAALARQSFEACLFRASRYPAEADIFINADSHDTWLRIKVPVYSLSLKPPEPLVPPSSGQQVGGSTSNDPKATSASPEPSAVPTEQVSVAGSSLAPEEPTPQNTTPPEEFYGFEGAYYRVNPSSRVECNLAFAADDFDPPPSEATYIGDRLGLVYVDESGELVGMGPCPVEGGFPVSNSCWASFNAGKQG